MEQANMVGGDGGQKVEQTGTGATRRPTSKTRQIFVKSPSMRLLVDSADAGLPALLTTPMAQIASVFLSMLMLLATRSASASDPVSAAPPTAASTSVLSDPAPSPELRWNDDWPRFRLWEYAVTGTVGPAAIAEYIWLPGPSQPHWTGGILFDDAVRDALRLRSTSALRVAWTAADVVGVSVTVVAVGVDSLIVPLSRGSSDVALQTTLMDLEAYALSSIVTITLYSTVGRARPSYADCKANPSFSPDCDVAAYDSFPSGHTNEAFTAAGLSCANHAHLPIYGSRLADTLACIRDVTLASFEGTLRIMGDRHYASDVLTGAAIGFGFGFGVPTLLHYRGNAQSGAGGGLLVSPVLGAGRLGLVASAPF
ncbi:MAG: phosphatase PAP2 family protein [Polyangiaceae bacterium]